MDQQTKIEFQKVDELVRKLLRDEPRTRDSDKWLTYRVFEEIAHKHGKKIFLPFELFEVFPAFETVKRCRAKIQNVEGLFMPTDPAVIRKRQQRAATIKKIMGSQ